MDHFLRKGDRIRARWFQASDACLAGMQPKTDALLTLLTGVVSHIRGDDPSNPQQIRVWIRLDDGREISIDPGHIVELL